MLKPRQVELVTVSHWGGSGGGGGGLLVVMLKEKTRRNQIQGSLYPPHPNLSSDRETVIRGETDGGGEVKDRKKNPQSSKNLLQVLKASAKTTTLQLSPNAGSLRFPTP